MKKFAILFLIFAFTMPAYAEQLQSKSIQQLLMENMTPQQKEAYLKKTEQEKALKEKKAAEREERLWEIKRLQQADNAQSTINFCNYAKNRMAEIDKRYAQGIYYDYMTGQCVMPEVPKTPAMVDIYMNNGAHGTGYIYY